MHTTTLTKRVAKSVALLEDVDTYVGPSTEEFFRMAGAELRELASGPRLTAVARKAVAEIARRKVNKALKAG